MKTRRLFTALICFFIFSGCASLQQNRQAWLRDTISPERAWWDLLHYRLAIAFDPKAKTIKGSNEIQFKTISAGKRMQIDLQQPLAITKVEYAGTELGFEREGDVYWVEFEQTLELGSEDKITIYYEGKPKESVNPPWVGGVTWGHDDLGQDFIVTTSQGVGASIFWPNKDHMYDEPDQGMDILVTVPEKLVAVANGRLLNAEYDTEAHTCTYHWQVRSPINNYGVNINIGNYVSFSETYAGRGGDLTVEYWVLAHQKAVAKQQFKEVPRMLEAFEYWFGPYPFYEDGYKLVAVSYAGMEHQSSVTYGNWFQNGYRGRDVSDTGVGYKFDFIIVHESGHEWFGNNITMSNPSDMWIHEGFTNYSENLFVEYWFGKEAAQDYVIGSRHNIVNDQPIIGKFSSAGSSRDIYYKTGNVLHTIRQVVNDDELWRKVLNGLNREFYHQTVSTKQIEDYMIEKTGMILAPIFDQYLRTVKVPIIKFRKDGAKLQYQYDHVIADFAMPLKVIVNGTPQWLTPTAKRQTITFDKPIMDFEIDRNFYVIAKQIN